MFTPRSKCSSELHWHLKHNPNTFPQSTKLFTVSLASSPTPLLQAHLPSYDSPLKLLEQIKFTSVSQPLPLLFPV